MNELLKLEYTWNDHTYLLESVTCPFPIDACSMYVDVTEPNSLLEVKIDLETFKPIIDVKPEIKEWIELYQISMHFGVLSLNYRLFMGDSLKYMDSAQHYFYVRFRNEHEYMLTKLTWL